MKITFDTWNQNPAMDKVTNTYEAPIFYKGQQTPGAYALDISGTVTDNNAYSEHGRSKSDVMQDMSVQFDNLAVQRDLMTVMSNIMSTEDFTKMMEDGFDPSKLEPEQVVTIVDHIKAEMAKSGQVVAGYNDDLNQEQLTEILGSSSLAKEVEAAVEHIEKDVKIAVMGCIVNGPGEAREADIGVAGGDGIGLLFRHGEILRKVKEEDLLSELKGELDKML